MLVSEIVFIYGLMNPENKELRYIGKSISPYIRLRKHISERNKHNSYKDRWIRKLLNNNIRPQLIIIDVVPKSEWQYWEMFYISYFKSLGCRLTNGTDGGDQPPTTKGRKHTIESRKKMSESKKGKDIPWLNNGKERTKEHRENLSNSLKGRKSPNKGKKFSKELREKLSNASSVKKKVKQFDLNGNLIKTWMSVNEAERSLNIRHISECCRGINYKTAGGYKWEYEN